MVKREKYCRMKFKVYEVVVLLKVLSILEFYEKELLNTQNLTLQPLKEIEKMRERLKDSIGDFNLRNKYALMREKSYSLTSDEWNSLQNSLCVSLGFQKEYKIFDEISIVEIQRLHKRFECTFERSIAGYKAQGYKFDEEKLTKIKNTAINHDVSKAIKKLK